MSGLRFQIGVPRAGSAARLSEDASASDENGGWTRGKLVGLSGSAARAAEEQKRAEGAEPNRSNTIALRASGGAVVDRETMLRYSGRPESITNKETCSHENETRAADFGGVERISPSRTVSAETVQDLPPTAGPGHRVQNTPASTGLLQSAAARIQSLTRSLFGRKGTSS